MAIVYNKLVRDRIPEIIRQDGHIPVTHVAADDEYRQMLTAKLAEEVSEFSESGVVEEISDVLEVLRALCQCHGYSIEDVEQIRVNKRRERGGFEERIVLEEVRGADET
jgi:predicted house-cleaning noncanonical NTP pyrophosphatase (MazG superfamily)